MTPPLRLVASLAALLLAVTLGWAGRAEAAECPTGTFLVFGGLVYSAEAAPAGETSPAGKALGTGTVDEPTSKDGCKRRRGEASVRSLGEVDPRAAVVAGDGAGTVFVAGARCAGTEGAERWRCITSPLVYAGRSYTAVAYPTEPAPRGSLTLGSALGEGERAGEPVEVAAIAGVDPAVAVAISGRSEAAFVAPGVCPYERFASDRAHDDLRRCLEGPVWLVFDPIGAPGGGTALASTDRVLPPELADASVALVRLTGTADVVPDDLSGAVPIGRLTPAADGRAKLTVSLPESGAGVYEAVVTCRRCAAAYQGRTVFPAGSVVVLTGEEPPGEGGSSWERVLGIALGAVFFGLLVLAVVSWRRGWHRRPPAQGSTTIARKTRSRFP